MEKCTIITGRTADYVEPTAAADTVEGIRQREAANDHRRCMTFDGWLDTDAAIERARKVGMVGDVTVARYGSDPAPETIKKADEALDRINAAVANRTKLGSQLLWAIRTRNEVLEETKRAEYEAAHKAVSDLEEAYENAHAEG